MSPFCVWSEDRWYSPAASHAFRIVPWPDGRFSWVSSSVEVIQAPWLILEEPLLFLEQITATEQLSKLVQAIPSDARMEALDLDYCMATFDQACKEHVIGHADRERRYKDHASRKWIHHSQLSHEGIHMGWSEETSCLMVPCAEETTLQHILVVLSDLDYFEYQSRFLHNLHQILLATPERQFIIGLYLCNDRINRNAKYDCEMIVLDREAKRSSIIEDCYGENAATFIVMIGILMSAEKRRLGFLPTLSWVADDDEEALVMELASSDASILANLSNEESMMLSLSRDERMPDRLYGRDSSSLHGRKENGEWVAVKCLYEHDTRRGRRWRKLIDLQQYLDSDDVPHSADQITMEEMRRCVPSLLAMMIFPRQSYQTSPSHLAALAGTVHGDACVPRHLEIMITAPIGQQYVPIPEDDWQVSSRRLARLMAELVGVIRWLYACGIVHGAISWANVVIHDDHIMLSNFDFSRRLDDPLDASYNLFEMKDHVDCMAIDLMKVLTSAHVRQVGAYNHLGRYDLESVLYLFIYVLAQNLHDDSAKEALFGDEYEAVKKDLTTNTVAIRGMKNGWDFRACASASRRINLNIYGDCAALMESLHRLRLDGLHSQDTRAVVLESAEPSPSQADVNRRLSEQDSDDHYWSLSERLQTAFKVYASSTPCYDDTTRAAPALIES